MNKLSSWKTIFFLCVFCAVEAISSPAQFTTLVSFNGTNGKSSDGALVQGVDGNFYGTTVYGGFNTNCSAGLGCGTVFKITPGGRLMTLYSFCSQSACADGDNPAAALVQATDGNLYGTSSGGGAYGEGTVFRITPAGELTTLHSFDVTDGSFPLGALVQAASGRFYGTTVDGGEYDEGTVFEITAGGELTTLHSFDGTDGLFPQAGLVQAANGRFYGTTYDGGASSNCPGGCGTVFEITAAGRLTTLHSFELTDGYLPNSALVQGTNGNFYGTTTQGGANGDGTVFQITAGGKLVTLHSFDNTDGFFPSGLVQGTNRNFYGTTATGGANGGGTIFEITPEGRLTRLYSFCDQTGCTDGELPVAALVQATNGNFYGTTTLGGTNSNCSGGCGTVFSLNVGLRPFVGTRPTSGRVETSVTILGNRLTDATLVTFNGTPARFEVVSPSEIKARVPFGATTGKVKVAMRRSMLTSNVNFRVP